MSPINLPEDAIEALLDSLLNDPPEQAIDQPRAAKPLTPAKPPPADPVDDLDAFIKELMAIDQGTAESPKVKKRLTIASLTQPVDLLADPKRSHKFLLGSGREGMLPLGSLAVYGAPGGMMKTAMAISIALHVATGQALGQFAVHESCVLILSMEDDADEITRRAIATAKAQIPPDKHHLIGKRVHFVDAPGFDARLTKQSYGATTRTTIAEQIIEVCKSIELSAALPVGLVVVDHARLAIGGDLNDSGAVTELTRALSHIAKETGAAVLLLCHSPKSTVNPNHSGDYSAADVLGSGAMVDNARFAAVNTPLTAQECKTFGLSPEAAKKHFVMRIIKSNYSEAGRAIYFRKTPVEGWGVVVPDIVQLTRPERIANAPLSVLDRVHALIQARPGQFTRTRFKTLTGKDGPLNVGTAAAMAALEELISSGRIIVKAPTLQERTTFSLGPQAKEVLHAS